MGKTSVLKAAESKWLEPQVDIQTLQNDRNVQKLGLTDASLSILANRGYDTPEKVVKLMNANLNNLHHPRLLKDADKGAKEIIKAVENNTPIVVYSDYDADGVSAAAVAMILLKKLGADVNYWTNNRFKHGYGMNPEGLEDMLNEFPDTKLIITCDNGIMSHEAIDMANELGIGTVVTDHHEPGDTLPNALAVINPKRKDCTYPFDGLCGAGVIFKVMMLVYWQMGYPLEHVMDTIDIVAMATVGDVVPLIDENRVIVQEGLKRINNDDRVTFEVFREVVDADRITAHFTIAFQYVPMINALGRLVGDPKQVVDMFLTDDREKIRKTIEEMKKINDERKAMTEEQMLIAEEIIEQKGLKSIIVVHDDSFHEGIVGLVAGRLKEKYHRPVFVFGTNEEDQTIAKGSGRGIDGFHLKETLEVLIKDGFVLGGGGHAKAAGCSVLVDKLEDFENAIVEIADKKLTEEDFIKKVQVDYFYDPEEITAETVYELQELEPFGEAFPKPVLGVSGLDVNKVFFMGEEKNHVKLRTNGPDVIMWRGAEHFASLNSPNRIKALGSPDLNVWNGKVSVQFIVQDNNLKSM